MTLERAGACTMALWRDGFTAKIVVRGHAVLHASNQAFERFPEVCVVTDHLCNRITELIVCAKHMRLEESVSETCSLRLE